MTEVATQESLAAMGDLVSKLVKKHGTKNKQILDGDPIMRKRKKIEKTTKKEVSEKRKQKKDLLEKGRVAESDVLLERNLNKIATKGVIQLFNAVKQHQKNIDTKLKKVKTEAQKDKISKSVTTGTFLDLIRPKEKEPDEQSKEKDKKWDVLKEDFMMNSKIKDWKKDDPESEESDGSIDDPESDDDESGANEECSSD